MSDKQRWPLADALAVAERLRAALAHGCERIEIAGSIRRKRPDPGDVELVAIPKPEGSLLWYMDGLDEQIKALMATGRLVLRPGKNGVTSYGTSNKFLVDVESGIGVDIFSTTEAQWAMSMVIRTGPRELNQRMMARFRELGYRGHVSNPVQNYEGEEVECADERAVFRLLGWEWAEPEERS